MVGTATVSAQRRLFDRLTAEMGDLPSPSRVYATPPEPTRFVVAFRAPETFVVDALRVSAVDALALLNCRLIDLELTVSGSRVIVGALVDGAVLNPRVIASQFTELVIDTHPGLRPLGAAA
ncbi:hypothetical protein GCM10009810_12100 [Nostocoides vanveenii]|uniref:Uncharacterized protein n=2 Tax=Nostocoides vanveenii TaxID=330835 RepID=A0ABP4WHI5_9MICO